MRVYHPPLVPSVLHGHGPQPRHLTPRALGTWPLASPNSAACGGGVELQAGHHCPIATVPLGGDTASLSKPAHCTGKETETELSHRRGESR